MLNVSMIFPADLATVSVQAGYDVIGEPIRQVLADLGVETDFAAVPASFCDGRFNLSHRGRKLCGLSQWRSAGGPDRSAVVLAHAVIIVRDAPDAAGVLNAVQDIVGDPARFDPARWVSLADVAGELGAATIGEKLTAAFRAGDAW